MSLQRSVLSTHPSAVIAAEGATVKHEHTEVDYRTAHPEESGWFGRLRVEVAQVQLFQSGALPHQVLQLALEVHFMVVQGKHPQTGWKDILQSRTFKVNALSRN